MVDIKRLTHELLDSVIQHECVKHAEILQKKDNEKEILRDCLVELKIFNFK